MLESLYTLNRVLGERIHAKDYDGIDSRQVIRLLDQGRGWFSIQAIGTDRFIEPGAVITFVNQRTKLATAFTAGANGRLPENALVFGEPGDRFAVRGRTGKKIFELDASAAGWFYDDRYPTSNASEALKAIAVKPRACASG